MLVLLITCSIVVFLLLNLLLGSVSIPFASVWNILTGGGVVDQRFADADDFPQPAGGTFRAGN